MPDVLAATNIYAWATVLTVLNLFWLILVAVGLPGNWLMVLSVALVAWLTWIPGVPAQEQMFRPATLIVLVSLAVLGEIVEFVAGAVGASRAGSSRAGALAALAGGLIGGIAGTFLIPIPVVGSLVGAAGGAGIGAWGIELSGGKSLDASLLIGLGAGLGRLAGTVAKLVFGAGIWLVASIAAFWA